MSSSIDLIIIGAGASGLFAAASPSLKGHTVLLLEKMPQPGLKLLLTGNGECNITNNDEKDIFLHHFGENGSFLKPALFSYPQSSLLAFLTDIAINTQSGKTGKIFVTGGATKLRDRLVSQIRSAGHSIIFNTIVTEISKTDGFFLVKTQSTSYKALSVLICAGGQSYPHTGSDGSSYHLAIGHTITKLRPSLSPVSIKKFNLNDSSGISFSNALLRLKKAHETKSRLYGPGDLLITHKGFSGPLILNNSRDFSNGDTLEICWNQDISPSYFDNFFMYLRNKHPKRQIGSIYTELQIPKNFFLQLLSFLSCDHTLKIADTSKLIQAKLKTALTAWSCQIESCGDFRSAMSTAGGVALNEIDRKTMMSRINLGLFFAGEYLDIDGDTGGYNLQAAFSTAWFAVQGVISYLEKSVKKTLLD